ncbi:Crp/Fnr family transcriptional regulator [Paenilisteria weihenstephanensis]|uniref:Crp/Fnr family transcriptional regulator n=1 Tax=Listeria weihenstephanensis TaxID=1006155 RepID=UPI00098CFB0A|nr:Crp/Fnr family transcriptional regulator [Listeria weihenstephanensis]
MLTLISIVHNISSKKKTIIHSNSDLKYSYLVESGYIKYNYTSDGYTKNFHILSPGRLFNLPILLEEIPKKYTVTALTDVLWWQIDFDYIRKILITEDPKHYIMLNHLLESRYDLFLLTRRHSLSSEDSIYFSLLRCVKAGIRTKPNEAQLPAFLNYEMLAELSYTSKTYTSDVLKRLREEGILISSKKPWIVTDIKRLRELLGSNDWWDL